MFGRMVGLCCLVAWGAVELRGADGVRTVLGSGAKTDNGAAGSAIELNVGQPFGVEVGPGGKLFVTEVEHHRVWRVDLKTGRADVVAGIGQRGHTGDGGPATKARLNEPYEVRFDRHANMFFVEMQNHLIRRVDAKTGDIATLAGSPEPGCVPQPADGSKPTPARDARFRQPHSIALDGDRWLYVADIGNHRICRLDLEDGTITTIAGNGERSLPSDGETIAGRPILGPRALFLHDGTLWIALREGHSVWALNLKTGVIRHVAGSGKRGYTGDGGSAKTATFDGPKGIAAGPDGKVYVVDTENQAIRQIDVAKNTIATVAGGGPKTRGYGGDGGPPTAARFDRPHGLAISPEGVLFLGDTNNHRVRAFPLK